MLQAMKQRATSIFPAVMAQRENPKQQERLLPLPGCLSDRCRLLPWDGPCQQSCFESALFLLRQTCLIQLQDARALLDVSHLREGFSGAASRRRPGG